jgi:ABC-2 type transport system permease protein
MTTATAISDSDKRRLEPDAARARLPMSRLTAWWTLYMLTLRQHLHGKRWMAVALLFLIPTGLAVLIRSADPSPPSRMLEFVLVWLLIPQALLPLVALLYASGIIQDEQEEQTITYLLTRPIAKWQLYTVKMAATWTTTVVLVIFLTGLTFAAVYTMTDADLNAVMLRWLKAAAILSLAAITYCSIFGAMSLLTTRTLIIGILYIAIVEGLLATFPLSLRWGTVIYHTRLIAYRSLDFLVTWPRGDQDDVAATAWILNIDADPTLSEHPEFSTSLLILLGASVVCTALAAAICSQREFHVKTPEKE